MRPIPCAIFLRVACLGTMMCGLWSSPAAEPVRMGQDPLDRLAKALLDNDTDAAQKLANDPRPDGAPLDWKAIAAQALRILKWPTVVGDSFREDVGKTVMIVSPRGTFAATVAGVTGNEVRLRVSAGKGFVEETLNVATLTEVERARRLKGYTETEKVIVEALDALRAGLVDEATETLRNVADAPLAAHLLASLQSAQSESLERDAERALRQLLDKAGFGSERAPTDQLLDAVQGKEFGASLAPVLREQATVFTNRFSQTKVANTWALIAAALAEAGIRSRRTGDADVATAIDALKRKNSIDGTLKAGHLIRDGKVELDLSGNARLKDLSPLEKLPICDLDLTGTGVRSLVPLKAMPLERLILDGTPVESLRGIEGCPLRTLSLTNAAITDLRAIKGAPLESLNLYRSRIKTLAGLEGAPLKDLTIAETLIADLKPLTGTPLTNLNASACAALIDIRPLSRAPLQSLYLWGSNVSDYRPLAEMPLKILHCMYLADLSPLATAPLDWLIISTSTLTDLRPLAKKQITVLAFNYCPALSDLSPLAGMPLISLDLTGCPRVNDLSSLRGMPLTTLLLDGTSAGNDDMAMVRDSLPNLVTLFLNGCRKVNDLQFLLSLKSLSAVSLPPGVNAIPVLEKHAAIATVYENGLPIPVKEYIASHSGKRGESR
ncbi:MAG TPA: hypothetical protein PLU30_19020 [Verrucomicrobiae bacterium]|nr:hypothetical protein [Verrucomicrobiae bacterium]